MDDNKKTNNINKNDDKKEIIVKNDLGVVSISNKIKKNNEKNQKINKKKELDEELEKAVAVYNKEYNTLSDTGIALFYQRKKTIDLIDNVEFLINSIANHPKEFDKKIKEIKVIKNNFKQICDFTKKELEQVQKSAFTAGVGVTGGLAVTSLAPSAAMWVATTFGTASTGTAISALSGAAANSAALAWLGGGSIAAGGAGVTGGQALLALAGPIGWSIAGATLLTSIILLSNNKRKIDKEKKDEIEKIKTNTGKIVEQSNSIKILLEENNALYVNIVKNYQKALYIFNMDYTIMKEEDKFLLGSIVNETKAIAKSIEKGIVEDEG
jgi:hypothetical protein